jgi:hypothetical protein
MLCVVVCLALFAYVLAAALYFGEGSNVGPGVIAAVGGTLVYHSDLIPQMISIGGLVHLGIFGGALFLFWNWSRRADWQGYFQARYPRMKRFWATLSLLALVVCMILAPYIFGWQDLKLASSLVFSFFVATELVTALGLCLWVLSATTSQMKRAGIF